MDSTSLDVLAPALDPRFKQLKFLNEEQKADVKEEIIRKMTVLSSSPQTSEPSDDTSQPSALDILLGPDDPAKKNIYATRESHMSHICLSYVQNVLVNDI